MVDRIGDDSFGVDAAHLLGLQDAPEAEVSGAERKDDEIEYVPSDEGVVVQHGLNTMQEDEDFESKMGK